MSIISLHSQRAELLDGKYDSFFRYHDGEKTQVLEDGDVESPYGHFTLREVTAEVLEEFRAESSYRAYDLKPGWYIDVRGSDGTVWAFDYLGHGTHSEENARAAFESHAEAYRDWYITISDELNRLRERR